MKPWRRRLLTGTLLLAAFVGVALAFASFFLPRSSTPRRVTVTIPPRAHLDRIASILQEREVIRSRHAFELMARILGEGKNLKAGEYELSPSLGLIEVIDRLTRGDATAVWFTIPEGLTIDQVAETLARSKMGEERRFQELVRYPPGDIRPPVDGAGRTLEGYLLPETYKLKKGASEKAIIRAMIAAFETKVLEGLAGDIRQSRLPLRQVIVLASLIEREARVPQDRPLISAVLHNRLKQKMRLQVDATVLYALGKHKDQVLYEDLKTDSPYNTYQNAGLPPGPICSPGLSSIQAALKPARTDDLFYVAKPDGSHIFSKTFAEHQQAIRRARAMSRSGQPAG
jgi:UPF0755 protein